MEWPRPLPPNVQLVGALLPTHAKPLPPDFEARTLYLHLRLCPHPYQCWLAHSVSVPVACFTVLPTAAWSVRLPLHASLGGSRFRVDQECGPTMTAHSQVLLAGEWWPR